MFLKLSLVGMQLLITGRHKFFKRRVYLLPFLLVYLCQFGPPFGSEPGDLPGCAHPGNYVFALGIYQVFPVKDGLAGARITGETDSCSGIFSHIPVNHGLDVYGGTPIRGVIMHFAVIAGPVSVPTVEYR